MGTEHEEAAQDYLQLFIVSAPIIVMLALVGLMMIVGLWWAWGRADRRWKATGQAGDAPGASDIWRESGRRATGDDKTAEPPVRPSIPEELSDDDGPSEWTPDEGDEYDPDEEEDEPWR